MTTETQAPEDLILLNTLMDDGAAMTEDRLISLRDAVVMVQQNLAFSIKEIIIRELKALPDAWQPIETAPNRVSLMLWIDSTDVNPHCFSPVSIYDDGTWWDDSTGDQIEPIAKATKWAHPPEPPK